MKIFSHETRTRSERAILNTKDKVAFELFKSIIELENKDEHEYEAKSYLIVRRVQNDVVIIIILKFLDNQWLIRHEKLYVQALAKKVRRYGLLATSLGYLHMEKLRNS